MTTNLKEELASLKIDREARGGGSRPGLWIALIVFLAVIAAGGWYLWSREPVIEVRTATAAVRTGAAGAPNAVLNASGYVTARRRATVSSKVTGKVMEIFVEEGKAVKRGQILARLDDSQLRAMQSVEQAQLASAQKAAAENEARLKEAELTLGRRQQLVKEKVISKAELDSAEAEVDSLKARIAMAHQQVEVAQRQLDARQTDLNDMVVRAPFDGVAISKDAQPGEMISPVSAGGGFTRTGICTIVDMSSLEIEVDVSESYINRVTPGQPVEAVLDAYPEWRIPSKVITSVPSADRQKATVRVRIAFDQLDPRILPDMGVKVSFLSEAPPLASAAEQARARVLVPKGAVRTVDGTSIVFVVRGDRVERRAVKLGGNDGDLVEVASGLTAGDKVVTEGVATLTDGARVKER
ncbi:MAG TPA: efflux RND transporter periplasmic adaptor subunit [Vicinamibacterales bacterium]|nr:efflux RND transporter periplasmic adaptor subunit [Vicinamibacterales bacterium]